MTKRARVTVGWLALAVTTSAGAVAVVTSTRAAAPTVLLLLPILAISYFGRLGPGLVAAGTSAVGAYVAFDEHLLRALAVLVGGILVCLLVEALHRSRSRERVIRQGANEMKHRLAQIFDASPVALSLSRIDNGLVLQANEAYLRMFELAREQIVGTTYREAGLTSMAEQRDLVFSRLLAPGDVHEHEATFQRRYGEVTVKSSSRAIELDGSLFALTTFFDVTAYKRAAAEARNTDAWFKDLAENIQEVFWLIDPVTRNMLYVSPAYAKIFGRSGEELYEDAFKWLVSVHPADRERIATFTATVPTARCEDTCRITTPGGELRSVRITLFPVRSSDGELIRIAGVAEDITDHLQLEEQVRQVQKLESLGLLAGGVAHDFNNILAVIASSASLLTEVVPPTHPDRELLDEIDAAVHRATALTRQLLAFSRKQVVEPIVLDLNTAVNDTRKMLRRMLGEDIVLTTSLEPELGRVRMDPGYLVQVLMNLAVNARDAMPRGGTLVITTRNMPVSPNREVMFSVTDNGCGMPAEVRQRVFEPFFTTKGIGKGTGLGLSVVHGIIQQAGGRIEIESEPELGTTLRIFLPEVDAPIDAIDDVAVAGSHGAEKLVLVDDDVFVRTSTSRSLRARGYQVLEASDGKDALRILRDHGKDVTLLVTDVVMPGMDGPELVQEARARRPSLKVLYMSGYTDDAVLRHGVKHAEVAMIEKPFRGHALAGKVRQVLDAPERVPR